MSEESLRIELCHAGRMLWDRGLIGAAEGNLSARIDADRLLCTPAGLSKGHLEPPDLVVIDYDGRPVDGGVPSSEILMHLRAYARRPDCMAVVHAHPLIATGFAVAGETIPDDLMPEAAFILGSVKSLPFAMPGTEQVPDSIDPYLSDHKTFLLGNHGALALGKSIVDATQRMETLERIAAILLTARLIGGPKRLPEEPLKELASQLLHGRFL